MRDVDNEGYHVPIAHPSLHDLYGGRYRDGRGGLGMGRSFAPFNEPSQDPGGRFEFRPHVFLEGE